MSVSENFKEHDFLEICRLTDRVQKKVKSHFITSDQIGKALRLYSLAEHYAEKVFVTLYGGFSFGGFKFKSRCTCLTLSKTGGSVSRIDAPERRHGKGDIYTIGLYKPVATLEFFKHAFPSFLEASGGDEDNLILSGN